MVALAVALVSACGSAASTGTTQSTGGRGVTVTWRDKGHTVSVARGTPILLKLSNTYWRVRGSSNARVVRQTGRQQDHPASTGSCVPGVGCGTVTAPFRAVGAGTAHLHASRSSCGEALACSHGLGRYDVTIHVHG